MKQRGVSSSRRTIQPTTSEDVEIYDARGSNGDGGSPDKQVQAALHELISLETQERTGPPAMDPPSKYDACAPPKLRTPPQFLIPFRRPITFSDLCLPVDTDGSGTGDVDHPHAPFGPLAFNCARLAGVSF